jgi:hypothetical protein
MAYWRDNAANVAMENRPRGIAIRGAGPMRAVILGIIAGLTVVLAVCVYLAMFRPP